MTHYPDIHFRKSGEKYNWFEVVEECAVKSNLPGLLIPKGYKTDFASIPRLLWPLLPPHGRMANAAIVHDFAYDNRLGEDLFGETKARKTADVEFAIRCHADGVPDWQVALAYIFVRLFGLRNHINRFHDPYLRADSCTWYRLKFVNERLMTS